MKENTVNIAYGISLMMKKHGKLSQAKASKRFKQFLTEIEPFISEDEFWELTEIENSLQIMESEEFEAWKKIASQFYLTRAQ